MSGVISEPQGLAWAPEPEDRRKQVGGDHYAKHKIQPWDVIEDWGLDFFAGNALKYLLRDKGTRLEDLQKLQHYVEKMIEREQAR
jgi:hypothetical protein